MSARISDGPKTCCAEGPCAGTNIPRARALRVSYPVNGRSTSSVCKFTSLHLFRGPQTGERPVGLFEDVERIP